MSGKWEGSATSVFDLVFPFEADLTIVNNAISGSIRITGSDVGGRLSGVVECDQVRFGALGGIVTFEGTVAPDGASAQGTYEAPSLGDRGTWVAFFVEPFADADGDALLDVWEEQGYDFDNDGDVDVDLPALGAGSDQEDIFVEVDWLQNASHSHRPTLQAINKVVNAFASARFPNDQGQTGISLHVVLDEAILETPDNATIGTGTGDFYSWQEFQNLKDSHFNSARLPIFHYALFAHSLPGGLTGGSRNQGGGASAAGASDFLVTLSTWDIFFGDEGEFSLARVNTQAGTFMHELGHNLGLGHGGVVLDGNGSVIGADDTNYKPNHLSVMNYSFQTRGIPRENGGTVFDYSRFGSDVFPPLNEVALNEATGVGAGFAAAGYRTLYYCGGASGLSVPVTTTRVDWNCNGLPEGQVQADINFGPEGEQRIETLRTQDEWAHIVFNGGAVGAFGAIPELPLETEASELTLEQDRQIGPYEGEPEVPTCAGGAATIVGTPGDDDGHDHPALSGTPGRDVIVGLGGRDLIKGFGGNDVICGGDERDVIYGMDGNDHLNGERRKDRVYGGNGDDTARGGTSDDNVYGENGKDSLFGDEGNDLVDGGGDTDSCDGGPGNDVVRRCNP
ncbi:MAG: calcium-binding protein [Acidimicrobiia bacterium]